MYTVMAQGKLAKYLKMPQMIIPASLVHSCLVSPPTRPLHPHPVIPFLQHSPSRPHDGQ